MSSKANKIEKKVEGERAAKMFTLYGSLMGSIIVTIGKLANKTEDFMLEDFARLAKDDEIAKCKNIQEVVDYIIKDYKMPEEFKKYIVLITDPSNLYTPIVSIEQDGYILPLDRNGNYTGVLSRPDFEMEYVFEEEGQ